MAGPPTVSATKEVNRLFALMREGKMPREMFKQVAEERLAVMCHRRIMNMDNKMRRTEIMVWQAALEDIKNGITRESDVGEPDDPSVERETP